MATLSRRSRRQNSCPGDRATTARLMPAILGEDGIDVLVGMKLCGRLPRAHGQPPGIRAAVMIVSFLRSIPELPGPTPVGPYATCLFP